MHVVEVWVDGVPSPFRLQFHKAADAEAMRDRIGRAASDIGCWDRKMFSDDLGQTLGFKLNDLKALNVADTRAVPSVADVSTQTWRERVEAEFERLGGPSMPDGKGMDGLPRFEAIERARSHADKSMLDEIHLMLRTLCGVEQQEMQP